MGTMTVSSPPFLATEVSPLRHVGAITARAQGKDDTIAYETFRALPSPPQPYSSYDFALLAEILRHAEAAIIKAYRQGKGSGILTLPAILQSYEVILPRHGVKPDEDTYYYRLLLKLSLDPSTDWWAKLTREATMTGRFSGGGGGGSPYASPSRQRRSSAGGTTSSVMSAFPIYRSRNSPHVSPIRRSSPYRSTASLARTPEQLAQEVASRAARDAAAEAAQRAADAAAAATAAVQAARHAANGATQLGQSSRLGGFAAPAPAVGSFPSTAVGPGWGDRASSAGFGTGADAGAQVGPSLGGAFGGQYGPGSQYGATPGGRYGAGEFGGSLGGAGVNAGTDPRSAAGTPHGAGWGSGRGGGGMWGDGTGGGAGRGGGGGASMGGAGEAVLDEETEAYLDFNRLARAFRTWRRKTFAARTSRYERDQALRNWAVATSFWAINLLRRCFERWRKLGPRKRALAMAMWFDNSKAGCFRLWLATTRYLREKGSECDQHWRRRLKLKCLRAWRQYTATRYGKAQGMAKALEFWHGRSLQSAWAQWRAHTDSGKRKNRSVALALDWWTGRNLSGYWQRWRRFTQERSSKAAGVVKALEFWLGRNLRSCWDQWRWYTKHNSRKAVAVAQALEFWHGRSLRGSFSLWRLYVEQARLFYSKSEEFLLRRLMTKWRLAARMLSGLAAAAKTIQEAERTRLLRAGLQTLMVHRAARHDTNAKLRTAVFRMRNLTLTWAFNKWAEAHQAKRLKREKLRQALGWWSNRALSGSWAQWREAVAASHRATAAARAHAQRILRPLLREAFYAWVDRYDTKADRRRRAAQSRHAMEARKARLVVLGWRGLVLERKHLMVSMQLIMRNEVHRLVGTSFKKWYREHTNVRRAAEAKATVRAGTIRRCLRHWKVAVEAKQKHVAWREERLVLARAQRTHRTLIAWRIAAGLSAEHGRLVASSLIKLHRRQATAMLRAWRERVLLVTAKRMKLLAGLLYWERATKARAWEAWLQRHAGWRAKAARWNLAGRHYRTRRLALCLAVMLELWQDYQARLSRALLYRSMRNDVLKAGIIAAWRQLVGWLQWKNDKARRAMAHYRSRLVGGALFGWYAVARHRAATRRAIAGAVLHWLVRRRAAAFVWWRNWTAYRRDLRVRGAGYALVRATRAKERVIAALKANVIRKARIAGAVAHRQRYMARLALSGWLLRTLLAADWVRRLGVVGTQLNRKLLADALEAWVDYTSYRRYKRGMLHAALRYWRLSRQRATMDALRWNATRRQLKRAVLLRGRMGSVARALRGWRSEADYRRRLRDRYALAQAGSRKASLRRGLDVWRAYMGHRAGRKELYDRALRHWLQGTAGRAFRTWKDYHRHLRGAEERTRGIARRWLSRSAAESLAALADYADYRRRKRAADATFKRSHSRRALQAWRELLKEKNAVGFWSRNRLYDAVEAWRKHASRSRSLKNIGGKVAKRWRNMLIASAMGGWRDYADSRRRLKDIGRLLSMRTRRGALSAVLGTWRDEAGYRARLKHAAHHLLSRTRTGARRAALRAWLEATQRRRFLKSTGATIARRMLASTLTGTFGAWKDYASYSRRLKSVSHLVTDRLRRGTLGGIFGTWREEARKMAKLKAILERVLLGSMALSFFGWREVVAEARRRKADQRTIQQRTASKPKLADVVQYAAVRLRNWPLALAFYTWIDNARDARYLRKKAAQAVMLYAGGLLWRAWSTWQGHTLRNRALKQKLGHLLAQAHAKTSRAVFNEWRVMAHYLGRLRRSAQWVQELIFGRTLSGAFHEWRRVARQWALLKGILTRIMARALSMAWEAWKQALADHKAALEAARGIYARWLHRDLALAFNGWLDFMQRRAAARRLALRVLGRTLDWAFYTWREAVFQAGVERGGELHVGRLLRRSLAGWRAAAAESRRGKELVAHMHQQLAYQAMAEMRRLWLARTTFRRLYARRALLGWAERTQELRQARARLWQAARVILYGSMARCFSAWLQYAQAQAIKRAVFIRKQRALVEALRRGDELAARRKAELVELSFRSWRLQAGIFRQVARRLNAYRGRALASAFADWREYAGRKKARLEKQAAVLRFRLLARPLRYWRAAARAGAVAAAEAIVAADAQRRISLLATALTAWREHHSVVGERRRVLRRAMAAAEAARGLELRGRAFDAWRAAVARKGDLLDLVDQVSKGRRMRILGGAFDVWFKYTQAMREGGIDPGSPYMSPREHGMERRLVTRMAAMAGNDQALAASSSVLDGLYPSAALQQAAERRQEVASFLALTRRAVSASRQRRDSVASLASMGSVGSASTGFSSGAGGRDLGPQAFDIVRQTPGLLSPGKGRGPASGLTPARVAARRADSLSAVDMAESIDDRVDLRALYPEPGPSRAQPSQPFGGFGLARPAAGSPMPLARGATPLTASAPIAPRRIDFTEPRGGSRGFGMPAAGAGYPAGLGRGGSLQGGSAAGSEAGYYDDDASTASSDFLEPAEARVRAAAARMTPMTGGIAAGRPMSGGGMGLSASRGAGYGGYGLGMPGSGRPASGAGGAGTGALGSRGGRAGSILDTGRR